MSATPGEAAQAIGCSRDFFDEHLGPELRWVRRGRLKFVAIVELQPAIAGILLFTVGVSFTLFTANANALAQLGARTTCAGE